MINSGALARRGVRFRLELAEIIPVNLMQAMLP